MPIFAKESCFEVNGFKLGMSISEIRARANAIGSNSLNYSMIPDSFRYELAYNNGDFSPFNRMNGSSFYFYDGKCNNATLNLNPKDYDRLLAYLTTNYGQPEDITNQTKLSGSSKRFKWTCSSKNDSSYLYLTFSVSKSLVYQPISFLDVSFSYGSGFDFRQQFRDGINGFDLQAWRSDIKNRAKEIDATFDTVMGSAYRYKGGAFGKLKPLYWNFNFFENGKCCYVKATFKDSANIFDSLKASLFNEYGKIEPDSLNKNKYLWETNRYDIYSFNTLLYKDTNSGKIIYAKTLDGLLSDKKDSLRIRDSIENERWKKLNITLNYFGSLSIKSPSYLSLQTTFTLGFERFSIDNWFLVQGINIIFSPGIGSSNAGFGLSTYTYDHEYPLGMNFNFLYMRTYYGQKFFGLKNSNYICLEYELFVGPMNVSFLYNNDIKLINRNFFSFKLGLPLFFKDRNKNKFTTVF